MTPCPYLPVFGGNLRQETLSAVWSDSELFQAIRQRKRLDGRCGACEFNSLCGGCRARAFGMTGDFMAEDPLCSYAPGAHPEVPAALTPRIEYGREAEATITWEPAAEERMRRVPAFVRGMVVRAVEKRCRERGIPRVTVDELERIRASMPTPKLFGPRRPS